MFVFTVDFPLELIPVLHCRLSDAASLSVPLCTYLYAFSALPPPSPDLRLSMKFCAFLPYLYHLISCYILSPGKTLSLPLSPFNLLEVIYLLYCRAVPSYSKKYKSKYRLIQKRKEMSLDIGNGLLLITTRFAATAVHALPFPEVKSARKIGTVFKSGARHVQTAQILVSLSNLSPRSTPAAREAT